MLASEIASKFDEIRDEIKEEYVKPDGRPWIIGFSGGKDSTLVLHLVTEALLELSHADRNRDVHVVANDTLVESPIVASYVDAVLAQLTEAFAGLSLPVSVQKTVPELNNTFWVNLIGRGYPAPTRLFRWCTDRTKIRPTTNYIRREVADHGEVVLLLGVRRSESSARAKIARKYDNGGRLNRHNDIAGCFVYRPILELTTEDVWEFLSAMNPPWGGTHRSLLALYRSAQDGECPVVMDPDAAPSCGSSSVRFGCWTCTVVEKDKSFRNSLEKGFKHLEPMAAFRDWLKEFCYDPQNRMEQRRNGQDGLGPLTFEARHEVLATLLELQRETSEKLISEAEIKRIKEIWKEDKSLVLMNKANRLLKIVGSN